jgi:hypothetical protein
MSSIIFIRNPDNTNAREFTVIVKPPPSIAGRLCNVRLLNAFVSDLYSVSDATSTQQDTSVAIEIYGFSTTQSTDTYTDQPSLLFGVLQNGLVARNPNVLVNMPYGSTLLKIKMYNTEFDWQRLRSSVPTPISKTHGYSQLAVLYRFESASGTTVFNDVGKTYDGTLTGTGVVIDTTTAAVGSSCLYLPGGAGRYFKFATIPASTIGISFSFWYKLGATGWSGMYLFNCTSNVGSNYVNAIYANLDSSAKVRIVIRNSTTDLYYDTTNFSLLTNSTWNHLAIVFAPGNTITVYHNGAESWSDTNAVSPPSTNRVNNFIGSLGTAGGNINGRFDDLRVYTKTLSLSEISELYSKDAKPSTCSLMLDCLPSPVNNM